MKENRKPFWKTPWFLVGLLLLLGFTIAGLAVAGPTAGDSYRPPDGDRPPVERINDDVAPVGSSSAENPAQSGPDVLGDILTSFNVEAITTPAANVSLGTEFAFGHYWFTGRSSTDNIKKLYKMNTAGAFVAEYVQQTCATSTFGWRDLASDGTYLYAGDECGLDRIDPATGSVVASFTYAGGVTLARALAYNPANQHFFAANFASSIWEFTLPGAPGPISVVNTFANTLNYYGMGWDTFSPGGPFLWGYTQDGTPAARGVQVNPTTGVPTGVQFQSALFPVNPIAGGADVECGTPLGFTNQLVMVALQQDTPDTIVVFDLAQPCSTGPTPTNTPGPSPTPTATRTPTNTATPLPPACVLLVDDDDNAPDLRPSYESALVANGASYAVFDTGITGNGPSAAQMAPYQLVIWESGDSFGSPPSGPAGPSTADETQLTTYLGAANANLFLDSQDYLYDHSYCAAGTGFPFTMLGLATCSDDDNSGSTGIAGNAADPIGAAFPSLTTSSPTGFSDFADIADPSASGRTAFNSIGGLNPGTSTNLDTTNAKTVFFTKEWATVHNFSSPNGNALMGAIMSYLGLTCLGPTPTPSSTSSPTSTALPTATPVPGAWVLRATIIPTTGDQIPSGKSEGGISAGFNAAPAQGQVQLSTEASAGGDLAPSKPVAPAVVLYDQYDNPIQNATSQDFEPANDAFDTEAADDFIIPGGPAWNIDTVEVAGVYSTGGGPAASFHVRFYANAGTLPGALLHTRLAQAYTGAAGDASITLVPPVSLGPGTYWVSVQARQDFTPFGQWFWETRSVQSNNPAAWQNPGGGFGVGCTTWGVRTTCLTTIAGPDHVYRLLGTAGPTPTPGTPTATFTPTSTPTPFVTGNIMDACSVKVGQYVYLIGGYNGTVVSAANRRYDTVADAWSTLTPMPMALQGVRCVASGGNIYVFGGWDSAGTPQARTDIYNIAGNSWSAGAAPPSGRSAYGLFQIGTNIYRVGGCTNNACALSNTVDVYSIPGNSWTAGAVYPQTIAWEMCAPIGSFGYCVGGTNTASTASGKGYRYDPVGAPGGLWSDADMADFPVDPVQNPLGTIWASGVGVDPGIPNPNQMAVFGGVLNNFATVTNRAWRFTPGAGGGQWSEFQPMIYSVYRLAGTGGSLYALGGSTGGFVPQNYNQVWLAGASTATPTSTPVPPTPTNTATFVPTLPPRCVPLTPDPFGYDCQDPGPFPVATYVAGVTDTGINSDDQVVTGIPIGFSFTFYGTAYTTVNVSSNGNLQFTTADVEWGNIALPDPALGQAIMAFWDDLILTNCYATGCRVRYTTVGTAPNRTFVMEWFQVPPFAGGPALTFEVQLKETTNDVYVLYQTMPGASGNGSSATLGVQRGDIAFQYSFNEAGATYDGLAIRYFVGVVGPTATPTNTPVPGCTPGWDVRAQVPISPSLLRPAGAYSSATGKVYVFGGRNQDATPQTYYTAIRRFDDLTNQWITETAVMPDSLVANMVVAELSRTYDPGSGYQQTHKYLYVVGGSGAANATTGRVAVYDPANDVMTTLPAADNWPPGNTGHLPGGSGIAYNNKLYVFGGFHPTNGVINSIYVFDPNAPSGSRWTLHATTLTLARSYIATAVVDGKILLIGGSQFVGGTLTNETIVEEFDPGTGVITVKAPLPTGSSQWHGFGVDSNTGSSLSGRAVAAGGFFSVPVTTVWVYNASTNTWSAGPAMPFAARNYARAYGSSADGWNSFFDVFYAIGGYDGTTNTPRTLRLRSCPNITPKTVSAAMTVTTPGTSGNVNLSWSAFPAATGYRVYRDTVPYFAPTIGTPHASVGGTSYTDTGALFQGVDYYYIVTAIQADGREVRYDNAVGKSEHLVLDGDASLSFQAFNDYPVQVDIADMSRAPSPEQFAGEMEVQQGWTGGPGAGCVANPTTIGQVLHWRNDLQGFEAWAHDFCFGDTFEVTMGEWYYLTINQAGATGFDPSQLTAVGRVPALGESITDVASGYSAMPDPLVSLQGALNAISAPGWRTDLDDMNKLANAIGVPYDGVGTPSVDQILNWENAIQNFLAWANSFQFGDNGVVEPWDGFFITVNDPPGVPSSWPW
jgi:N-acetylneuraminic acid mutarotase